MTTRLTFFKKTASCKGDKMKICEGIHFEYSTTHPDEVWIKYSFCADDWHKFSLCKRGISAESLTFPSEPAYPTLPLLNSAKVDDLKKIVYKFVPREFRDFFNIIAENTVDSSLTNSSEVFED